MPPEVLLRVWTGQHLSRRDSNMKPTVINVAEFEASNRKPDTRTGSESPYHSQRRLSLPGSAP